MLSTHSGQSTLAEPDIRVASHRRLHLRGMHFVAMKSVDQQAVLALHRSHEFLIDQRTLAQHLSEHVAQRRAWVTIRVTAKKRG